MGGQGPWDVVIVGAGIAGLSTAIWARRLGLSVVVLEGERHEGGQLRQISGMITDYPGVQQIAGTTLSTTLRAQAEGGGAVFRMGDPVSRIEAGKKRCVTESGEVTGRALVLATGLSPRRLDVPGLDQLVQQSLIRRPSVELTWFQSKRVAVVGGGDRAAENALLLREVAGRVYLIHRREQLRAREPFVRELQASPNITLLLNTTVSAFDVQGRQVQVRLAQSGQHRLLDVEAVCIYIGNRPNSDLVEGQLKLDDEGYIVVDRNGETSVRGVYAVGDVCTPPAYQSLVSAAGQAMVVAKHIALQLGR